jgi:hypothetical protein
MHVIRAASHGRLRGRDLRETIFDPIWSCLSGRPEAADVLEVTELGHSPYAVWCRGW